MSQHKTKRFKNTARNNNHLLPYNTIQAATKGNPDAVNAVLRHYEGYITSLSMRRLSKNYHSEPLRLSLYTLVQIGFAETSVLFDMVYHFRGKRR